VTVKGVIVLFGLGRSSADRYIRALAVCSSLAQLASQGSEAEFLDHLSTLLCLKKHWTEGHADAKVVCGSARPEDETVANTLSPVEIQNISFESILSRDSVTESQRVLVLCSKTGTTDGNAAENSHQQTECYNVFPSLLTVPSAGEYHIIGFLTKIVHYPCQQSQ